MSATKVLGCFFSLHNYAIMFQEIRGKLIVSQLNNDLQATSICSAVYSVLSSGHLYYTTSARFVKTRTISSLHLRTCANISRYWLTIAE